MGPTQPHELLGSGTAFGARISKSRNACREALGQQRRTQCLGPAGCAVGDVAGEQFAQHHVLLGPGDQARRRVVVGLGLQAQHRKRIGVDGPYERLACGRRVRAASGKHPSGDLLTQRDAGATTRRQDQDRFGIDGGIGEPRDRCIDDHRGLAGAGPPWTR